MRCWRARARDRIAPRVVARRLLWQRCEKGGLGGRQRRDVSAEVGARRPLRAGDLIPVRGEVQIEREDVLLAQLMLQPQREHRFADLRPPAARRLAAVLTGDEHLRDLLRDRRAAFDDGAGPGVVPERAPDRDRIHARMAVEADVLGRDRRVHQRRRQGIHGQRVSALAQRRSRFEQPLAVPIDDDRGLRRREFQQPWRQRPAPQPHGQPGEGRRKQRLPRMATSQKDDARHLISTTTGAARPFTSGAYICSTDVPATRNVPAVVARMRYENSCRPSARRVAKSATRSS